MYHKFDTCSWLDSNATNFWTTKTTKEGNLSVCVTYSDRFAQNQFGLNEIR